MVRIEHLKKLSNDELLTKLKGEKPDNCEQLLKSLEITKYGQLDYKKNDLKKLFEIEKPLKEPIETFQSDQEQNSFKQQKQKQEEEQRLENDVKLKSPGINDLKECSEMNEEYSKEKLVKTADEESKLSTTLLDELVVTNSVLNFEKQLKQMKINDEKELEEKHKERVKMFEKFKSPSSSPQSTAMINQKKILTEQIKSPTVEEKSFVQPEIDTTNDPVFKQIAQTEEHILNFERDFRLLLNELIHLNKIDKCKTEIELCEASIDRINDLIENPFIDKLRVIAKVTPQNYEHSSTQLLENLKSLENDSLNKIRQANVKLARLRQTIEEEEMKKQQEIRQKQIDELRQQEEQRQLQLKQQEERQQKLKQEELRQQQLEQEKQRQQQLQQEKERQQQQQIAAQQAQSLQQQVEAQAQTNKTDGDLFNKRFVMESAKRVFDELEEFYEKTHQELETLFASSQPMKTYKFDLQKAINFPINALLDDDTNPDAQQKFKDKIKTIQLLLSGKTCSVTSVLTVNPTRHPKAIEYCVHYLARKIVEKSEESVSSRPETAFQYAQLAVLVIKQIPIFEKHLFAVLFRKCPYVIPYYKQKQKDESIESYFSSLGYRVDDAGKVEEDEFFFKRMSGILHFYFTLLLNQEYVDKHDGMKKLWNWLSDVLNMKPRANITTHALTIFMKCCGATMQRIYRNQFKKIMSVFITHYLPLIKAIPVEKQNKAFVGRLELLIDEYKNRGFFNEWKKD